MITPAIIDRIFDAATIQRWNDHVRPMDLTELDKQAHKAMLAYVIARFEADAGHRPDWTRLIEQFLFEFFHRVVLTDIKAPLFHRLMKTHGEAINRYVQGRLNPMFGAWNPAFADRMRDWLLDPAPTALESRILKAAHYLATQWEFRVVSHSDPGTYGFESTRQDLENELEDYIDLIGVQKINLRRKIHGFIDLCGQLRCQYRWALIPRIPRTSVLGHSLFVAVVVYLISLESGACRQRCINNFCSALFHDLPEIFTRDIVTPVKRSISQIEQFIEAEERLLVREKLLPLIPRHWQSRMLYLIEDPFENRVWRDGRVERIASNPLDGALDRDELEPVDGKLIKECDELAAFTEAAKSIANGIHPPTLIAAVRHFEAKHPEDSAAVPWRGLLATARTLPALQGDG
jgi:putative hydrolase of HD superfamily